MVIYYILAFLLGGWVGYLLFYLRYEHRGLIDELRDNFQDTKRQLENVQHDSQEHLQQNVILKEKVTELMTKNDDLSRIVSELSRYYYHIKLGAEKASELEKILHIFDKDIEEKMKYTLGERILESLHEWKKSVRGDDDDDMDEDDRPRRPEKNRIIAADGKSGWGKKW